MFHEMLFPIIPACINVKFECSQNHFPFSKVSLLSSLFFQPTNNSSAGHPVLARRLQSAALSLLSLLQSIRLSLAGDTSLDNNNSRNELTGKWQLSSDQPPPSGLNSFTAAHNGFCSQGPGVTNTTHTCCRFIYKPRTAF